MKKLMFSTILISIAAFVGCTKKDVTAGSTARHDNTSVTAPTADFLLYQLDSAKVYTFSQGKIDTLSNLFASDYFLPLAEGTSTRVYKGKVIVKYTGSTSDYRVVYTGDPSHIYVADPANPPAGTTGSQSGVNFPGDIYTYNYAPGSYTVTVISSNGGDKGREIVRSIASKRIIVR
jgi:hypothetical protein